MPLEQGVVDLERESTIS